MFNFCGSQKTLIGKEYWTLVWQHESEGPGHKFLEYSVRAL